MKEIYFLLLILGSLQAQVLTVPQVIQEQNQWCWAGATKCIMDYDGYSYEQCEIAEFTRITSIANDYGTVDCCVDPNVGCNYWNYNYGYAGSMEDILESMALIQNYGVGNALSLPDLTIEIGGSRPFLIRWGWYAGGGHFLVGHGVSGSDVYYMNPWFGEGLHVADYSWLVDDGSVHTWTHTNVITSQIGIEENDLPNLINIYPNPASEIIKIEDIQDMNRVRIYNTLGETMYIEEIQIPASGMDISMYPAGIYFIEIKRNDKTSTEKFIKY